MACVLMKQNKHNNPSKSTFNMTYVFYKTRAYSDNSILGSDILWNDFMRPLL